MRKASTAIALATLLALGSPTAALAVEPAKPLPSAYEAELKNAKRIGFGQRIALASECQKSTMSGCTKYRPVAVTVRSMTPSTRAGWPDGTPTFNLDVTVQNLTGSSGGLLPTLRCANSTSSGSFYADSVETQSIPAKSQQSGIVIVSFPEANSQDNIAIKPSECLNAVLWLKPVSSFDLTATQAKKAKMFGAAYIPLTPEFLATLPQTAPTPTG